MEIVDEEILCIISSWVGEEKLFNLTLILLSLRTQTFRFDIHDGISDHDAEILPKDSIFPFVTKNYVAYAWKIVTKARAGVRDWKSHRLES